MRKWFKGLAALALAINMMPALSIKAEEELNLDGESAVLIDADSRRRSCMRKMRMTAIIPPVLQKS